MTDSLRKKRDLTRDRMHFSIDLALSYREVRGTTEALCRPLKQEDYVLQSMPDASPAKWHLAHTTWFFETFLLAEHLAGYQLFNPKYQYLFNSYYNTVGAQFDRPSRGLLSRPTVEEIYAYRHTVDEEMQRLLPRIKDDPRLAFLIEIGLNHEQQHQELLLTDIKHALSCNPLEPAYRADTDNVANAERGRAGRTSGEWVSFEAGVRWLGHMGEGFAFDNEKPRHRVFVEGFQIFSQLVTVGEYLRFIEDDGYLQPRFWLSDGWAACQQNRWDAPLYWKKDRDQWSIYTLDGARELCMDEPVSHLSYYEADAFAQWADARLPTEAEWRALADQSPLQGNLLEQDCLHPVPAREPLQVFGDVWEWTSSAYGPYPGYQPLKGALGEYNGKFMCNQFVLRGGSCVTPLSHLRRSYRNFFHPDARWQFTGLRLAKNL